VADAIINATTAQKEEDTEEVTQEEGN